MAYNSPILPRIYNRQSIGFIVQMNFMQFMNKIESKSNDKFVMALVLKQDKILPVQSIGG